MKSIDMDSTIHKIIKQTFGNNLIYPQLLVQFFFSLFFFLILLKAIENFVF